MSAPKLTAEQALRRVRHQDFFNCDPSPLTDALAGLGYTLIPTDPASVEDMVERGAEGLCDRERGQKGSWAEMRAKHNVGSKQPAVPRLLADARAVLTAAIPELKK